MSVQTDIKEQRLNEIMLACAIARRDKALIYPNANGKDSAKDFTLFVRTLVEVKWDIAAERTGNFYFEIHNTKSDQPSGLAVTKATVWYHFVPPSRLFSGHPKYLLSTLQGLLASKKAVVLEGGDDNSRGIVVNIKTALETGQLEETTFIP